MTDYRDTRLEKIIDKMPELEKRIDRIDIAITELRKRIDKIEDTADNMLRPEDFS